MKTKVGDLFEVLISSEEKRYFQFIGNDITQLNSDVIRVFSKVYNVSDETSIENIVNDNTDFYAHCFAEIGAKRGFWKKIGRSSELETADVWFRDTSDYGSLERIEISEKWYIWKMNEEFIKVGKLTPEYQTIDIGVVFPPDSIVHKIKTGVYDFRYPGY